VSLYARYSALLDQLLDGLVADGLLPADASRKAVAVEPPRDPSHGDLATNAAMVLAKAAGKPPRALAEALKPGLEGLPGGNISLVRVVAQDGANAGSDASNGSFSVPAKAPSALILTQNATVKRNELLVLEGALLDLEDSDISPGVTYEWRSSRDGLLGTSATIGTQLQSDGLHTITFTATDRDGNSASATRPPLLGSSSCKRLRFT